MSDGTVFSTPATEATLSFAPLLSAEGSANGRVGSIDIDDGIGTIEIRSRVADAIVYRKIPWQDQTGRTLYQTLALTSDVLYVCWLYCDDGGRIREVWLTGTDGTSMHEERASGSYDDAGTDTVEVAVPGLSIRSPTTVTGYEIDGGGLVLERTGRGRLTYSDAAIDPFGGSTVDLYAFDRVDCRFGCGGRGWEELHCLLWNADGPRLSFGIVYLYPDASTVSLSYLLALPGLAQPGQQRFEATRSRA